MAQKSLFKTSTVSAVIKSGRAAFTGIAISPTTVDVIITLRNSTDVYGDKLTPTMVCGLSSLSPRPIPVIPGVEVQAENGIYLSMSTATGAEVTVYYRND